MVDENQLAQLYSARLDELREMAVSYDLSKAGNVEQLRARLINEVALAEIDLSWDPFKKCPTKNWVKCSECSALNALAQSKRNAKDCGYT